MPGHIDAADLFYFLDPAARRPCEWADWIEPEINLLTFSHELPTFFRKEFYGRGLCRLLVALGDHRVREQRGLFAVDYGGASDYNFSYIVAAWQIEHHSAKSFFKN